MLEIDNAKLAADDFRIKSVTFHTLSNQGCKAIDTKCENCVFVLWQVGDRGGDVPVGGEGLRGAEEGQV